MFRLISTLLFSLLCISFTQAQHLKRHAPLGIQPGQVSVSETLKMGWDKPQGSKILQVFPSTTADRIGIQVGDIILDINGKKIVEPADLFAALQPLKEGDAIQLEIWRSGENKTLKGEMTFWDFSANPDVEKHYEEVAFQGGYLRAYIEKPKGEGPFPTIYFLQGYPCSSVAFKHPKSPFRQLINQFVSSGYAVYRVEKPGVGDSEGPLNCMEIDFATELAAFKKAGEQLTNYDYIDQSQIFIYGHSLGGYLAPFVGQHIQPKGIMVYGFDIRSWETYMADLVKVQFPLLGTSEEVVESYLEEIKPLFYEYYTEKKDPKEFLKTDRQREVFSAVMEYDGHNHCINRHYTFWQSINEFDAQEAWLSLDCPVLSMYGEIDLAALSPEPAEMLAQILNEKSPGQGTFKLIPSTNHLLLVVPDLETEVHATQTHQMGKFEFNKDYPGILDSWMSGIMEKG